MIAASSSISLYVFPVMGTQIFGRQAPIRTPRISIGIISSLLFEKTVRIANKSHILYNTNKKELLQCSFGGRSNFYEFCNYLLQ